MIEFSDVLFAVSVPLLIGAVIVSEKTKGLNDRIDCIAKSLGDQIKKERSCSKHK